MSGVRVRPLIGLGGVLVAVFAVTLNDQLLSIALRDVGGGLGYGNDTFTWLPTLFVTGEVLGMATAPTLGLIFTLRRFALFAIALSLAATLLMPFTPGPGSLLGLRMVQGLAAGFTIPLLMTTALRVLSPPIRLFGLALYAMSATVVPNLGATIAALWTDGVADWRFIFFGTIPLSTVAALLVWWGMDQDAPRRDMARRFDYPGAAMVAIGFGSLSVVLEQGDRLDWYNSPKIAVLTLVVAVTLPLFALHELRAPQPLFKLALLGRRNFAYASIALICFLVIALGASQVPLAFLERVQGYRPLQAHVLTLTVALSQLALLPATALLLDHRHVDPRWVSAVGYGAILVALFGAAHLNASWTWHQFVGWELLQSIGFAFVVMPLLMMATNTVKPEEGPFASGMVNTPRAIAEAIGVWALELIGRWRGGLHRNRIVDLIGQERLALIQATPLPGGIAPPLTPAGGPRAPGALAALDRAVEAQVTTLVTIDTYAILGCVVVFLLVVLATLAERTYPPRIALAKN